MDFLSILFFVTVLTGTICLYVIFFERKNTNENGYLLNNIKSISYSLFPIFLLVFIIRSFLFEPFRIPSGSMKPTLLEGDFILVEKYKYDIKIPIINKILFNFNDPKYGDVIVFKHGKNTNMIKRIVGLPQDKILYSKKFVYINGEIQKQYDLGSTTDMNNNKLLLHVRHKKEVIKNIRHEIYHIVGLKSRKYKFNNIIIPKDKYFVMGDFRDNSQDSRIWGLVRREQIIGKAIIIWMSWDNNVRDIRWERLGKKII